MARLFGNAAIVYTSTSEGEKAFDLRAPLRAVRPAVQQVRFVRESMDFSVREVSTIGPGVHEIIGTIRYVDAPQDLMDMILAGLGGVTVTLIPDVTDQSRSFDCYLIDASETADMDPDRGFPGFEELSIDVRLRKTDGTRFV